MGRTIVISGASGLIGSALTDRLRREGDRVIALVRRPARTDNEISWDPAAGQLPDGAIDGVDVVVNLNGLSLGDGRWTDERKRVLVSSRVDPTGLLARAIASSPSPPPTFLSIAPIGIYGQDRGDEILDESAGFGDDFLARLAVDWEEAAQPAAGSTRLVCFRTGLVLAREGELLGRFLPLFKAGLGGTLGSGKQWMSWITIDDQVAAMVHLMDSSLSGPVNLVAPQPVTNAEFTRVLARVLGRPALFTIPRFALDIRLGREMALGTALASQRVSCEKLRADGFQFSHIELEPGLRYVLGR